MKIRTGLGYDIHRLEEGRRLFLGGVEIPSPKGLIGHSDGDCLIHAIIDALLGAIGERDIGQIFPDQDPEYKDIRSTELLKDVIGKLKKNEIEIVNIDSIVIAEKPRLASYISQMKEVLCPILGVEKDDLGIKAKTNEGLGGVGKGEAIASWAQVLVEKT
ncbi:MAG: 2-C-methyl-D-erythritol 2,4-cyclodiphosphate synthase [Candidatus Aminicenantes bacterium]|nr:MAG: 2-C-methyl-D-erythritol 2,4-cyclodiphosphate synthase [Candidatus Aminicenantes bacterium]